MNNLKNALKILPLCLLILTTACKKEQEKAPVVIKPITTEDLLDYRIAGILKGADSVANLRLFYFAKEGKEIKCTMDGIVSRRIQTVNLVDNSFSFDPNGDGNVVYTFTLARKAERLTLSSSKYFNINNPDYTFEGDVYGSSDFSSVKNKTFKTSDNTNLKFNTETWLSGGAPGITGTFYEVFPGAWKGALNGVDYMGMNAQIEGKGSYYMNIQKSGEKEMIIAVEF